VWIASWSRELLDCCISCVIIGSSKLLISQFDIITTILELSSLHSRFRWSIITSKRAFQLFSDVAVFLPILTQHLQAHSTYQVGPRVVSLALKAFSRIDALIINHGTLTPVTRIADSNPKEWRAAYDVNLFSAVAFVSPSPSHPWHGRLSLQIKPAIPSLRQTHGRIILTSSGAATGTYSTWGAYGSSKAALNRRCWGRTTFLFQIDS